jgi:hypothetical protein
MFHLEKCSLLRPWRTSWRYLAWKIEGSKHKLQMMASAHTFCPHPTATPLAARDSQQPRNLSPSLTASHHSLSSSSNSNVAPPQPLLLQQQQPGHPPPFQHPAQHNGGQPLGIYNSNSNSAGQQWSQGADGPTVNNAMFLVNPMQHSMQMHPQLKMNLWPFFNSNCLANSS